MADRPVKLSEADKHPEHYEPVKRGTGEDTEWSVGIGESIVKDKPARLFVRLLNELVIVRTANVTSWSPRAFELGEGAKARQLAFGSDEIRWLLTVLPEALAILEGENAELPATPGEGAKS